MPSTEPTCTQLPGLTTSKQLVLEDLVRLTGLEHTP
jgi:hypothetical protein